MHTWADVAYAGVLVLAALAGSLIVVAGAYLSRKRK